MTHIKKSVFVCLLQFAEEPGANQDVIRNILVTLENGSSCYKHIPLYIPQGRQRTLKPRRIDVQGFSRRSPYDNQS